MSIARMARFSSSESPYSRIRPSRSLRKRSSFAASRRTSKIIRFEGSVRSVCMIPMAGPILVEAIIERSMKTYRHNVIVHWGDTDPARIVFYPNYFAWFDESTRLFWDSVGLDWDTLGKKYGVIG